MHVCARTLKDAIKILNAARLSGFKKSGIISCSKRVVIEINSIEYISTIVSKNKKILVTDDYLKILVQQASQNLLKTRKKLEKFYNLLKKLK